MQGVGDGVDRDSTRALLESGELSEYQAGCLRKILAGAVYTEDRASKHFKRGSAECPFCGHANETRYHMWWECSRWEEYRRPVLEALPVAPVALPKCLTLCGILPSGTPQYETYVGIIQKVQMAILQDSGEYRRSAKVARLKNVA